MSAPLDALRSWLGWLLPPGACRLCGGRSRTPLCQACRCAHLDAAARRCPRCALRLPPSGLCPPCLRQPAPFHRCLTLADYAPPLDALLQALKFGDEPALGRWFGNELGQRWRASGMPLPQLLVPVPLSRERLIERGYNQSWEIARGLGRSLGVAARCDLLQRCRDAPAQSGLALRARRANVADAFVACPAVAGLCLLLVDDVMTSGHTAAAACRALRRAGARQVMLAVALRTPAPP